MIEVDGPPHLSKWGNNDAVKYKELYEWINRLGDGSAKGSLLRLYHKREPKPNEELIQWIKDFWNTNVIESTSEQHEIHLVGFPDHMYCLRVKEVLSIFGPDIVKVWDLKWNSLRKIYEGVLVNVRDFYQSVCGMYYIYLAFAFYSSW